MSSRSSSSSRIYIDITDDDETINSNFQAENLAQCRKEMAVLQAQVHALQQENSGLRSELLITQSELGKAVVAHAKQNKCYSTTDLEVEGDVRLPTETLKRSRSPSLDGPCSDKEEIVHSFAWTKKIKLESVKTSPSQMRKQAQLNLTASPTKPIHPKAEPSASITRNPIALKRPGADRPLTISNISSQQDLNTFSSAAKVTPPASRSVSAVPLIAGPPKSSKAVTVGQEKGGRNPGLLCKSLKKYLESAPTLPIHPPPLKTRLKRGPFCKHYGGTYLQFLQYISPENNPSGDTIRNLVFPQPLYNPLLPVAPGEPGLIFASRHEVANGVPWSLFVKDDPSFAIWTYLGDYTGEICGHLTPEQFKALSEDEQETWFGLLQTRKSGIYLTMRIRIALRKIGLIPLDDKEEEDELIKESTENESDFKVTLGDVRTALYEGQEVIDLIRMTCISYDHVFANDIRRNFTEAGIRRT